MTRHPGSWAYEVRERLRSLRLYTATSLTRAAGGESGCPSLVKVEGHESVNLYLDALAGYCRRMGHPIEAVLLPWRGGRPQGGPATTLDHEETVRAKLRDLVQQHGLRPLATRAGLHHSTLARWASGEYRRLDLHRLERLAQAAGLDPADLILTPHTGGLPQ